MAAAVVYVLLALAQPPHQHHPPGDAAQYARVLNNPQRDN
jgi:hypothetical protein